MIVPAGGEMALPTQPGKAEGTIAERDLRKFPMAGRMIK